MTHNETSRSRIDTGAERRQTDQQSSDSSWPLGRRSTSGHPAANRGQSNLVGFILLVGIVMMLFTLAQVHMAPQVEAETEFEHASEVLKGAAGIQSDTVEAAASGNHRASTLQMGSTYPEYLILLHPPDPSGSLRTSEPQALELRNAAAVRDETADHIDGGTQTFTHTRVRYSPDYHEFRSAGDTTLEQGTLYEDFESTNRVIATPNVVNGNQLTLIASTGEFSQGSRQAKIVETVPLSASEETVLIQDTGNPIQIAFESGLSVDKWEKILESELDPTGSPNNDRFVTDISKNNGMIVLTLEPDATYEANYAKLGYKLGEQASFADDVDPDPAYLTTTEPTSQTVQANATEEFTVQARDRYSNPVSNAVVDVGADRGSASIVSPVTRQNGEVTIIYEAPASGGVNDTITAEFQSGSSTAQRTVTFDITVQD